MDDLRERASAAWSAMDDWVVMQVKAESDCLENIESYLQEAIDQSCLCTQEPLYQLPMDVVGDADMVRWTINRELLLPPKEKPLFGRCTLAQLQNLSHHLTPRISTWAALKVILSAHANQNAAKQEMPFAQQRSSDEPMDNGISSRLAEVSAVELGEFIQSFSTG